MTVLNKFIAENDFMKERDEVLNKWSTGSEVDLEEAIEYHKNIDKNRIMINKLLEAKKQKRTLTQPRGGVALVDDLISFLKDLYEKGEADLLPVTIDSYTRQHLYKEAEKGIKESKEMGRSMLNGFPAVNYGVKNCRKLIESLPAPLQVRHGTPDARLLAEITLAGGFSDFEGGGISYNIPYAKNVSLKNTIKSWQYVDRLVGYYQDKGIDINREPYGALTGTLVPPFISHSIGIIESLLAAEQGVKYISPGYGQNGNLIQDVAAVQTLAELTEKYLVENGYNDVEVTTVFHQWMGGFPQDEAKAYAVIGWGSAVASLANATRVIVKSPREAMGSPTCEANVSGLKSTKQMINILFDQELEDNRQLQQEKEMIEVQVKQLMDRVKELGEGDWALGAVKAFEKGVLDIPFAPSEYNKGQVMPARDNNGAVRILNFGNLPFTEELKKFHRDLLKERAKTESRKPGFQMVIDDIYSIGKGMLVGRPGKN